MPDITVVIPVYNVEGYLEKCVASVECQSYRNFEIILVDDGSTDASGALCDTLAAKYDNIRVLHQENRGLGGARNTGIRHCETPYILFLDSDDRIHPALLERGMAAIKENACDMVLFDMVSVDENGKTGSLYGASVPVGVLLSETEKMSICSDPSACDKLYRTALFKEHDIYYPNKVWYEDLRTTPKLLSHAERVLKLDSEPLYYYLQRSDSIMHTPDRDRIVAERLAATEELYAYFRKQGTLAAYDDMLSFTVIYHAFLLPCLEMHRRFGCYGKHLNVLLAELHRRVPDPLSNPYLSLLRKNERIVLKLALRKCYFAIACLTLFNRMIKEVKHA